MTNTTDAAPDFKHYDDQLKARGMIPLSEFINGFALFASPKVNDAESFEIYLSTQVEYFSRLGSHLNPKRYNELEDWVLGNRSSFIDIMEQWIDNKINKNQNQFETWLRGRYYKLLMEKADVNLQDRGEQLPCKENNYEEYERCVAKLHAYQSSVTNFVRAFG
ncbi:hypothetical protein [Photobacterium kishitanii]|nr:hypothetical protein [Photobacterium kishitanii]